MYRRGADIAVRKKKKDGRSWLHVDPNNNRRRPQRMISLCEVIIIILFFLGRLINHSRKNSNCQPKVFVVRDQPRLILVALREIEIGEELLYDYGERRKDIIEAFPWLSE